jgi:cytochrome d ubiquinol oxidase subunit II
VTESNLLAARMQMALTLATVIWGWAVAQYPFVVPPAIRVDSAPAPAAVLQLMAWSTAGGGC